MTSGQFKESLAQSAPPTGLSIGLQALWWAGKDDWERAHKLVMGADGADAAWVHAYLHRVEGDLSNAKYWYRQADQSPASGPLDDEWKAISGAMLARAA